MRVAIHPSLLNADERKNGRTTRKYAGRQFLFERQELVFRDPASEGKRWKVTLWTTDIHTPEAIGQFARVHGLEGTNQICMSVFDLRTQDIPASLELVTYGENIPQYQLTPVDETTSSYASFERAS